MTEIALQNMNNANKAIFKKLRKIETIDDTGLSLADDVAGLLNERGITQNKLIAVMFIMGKSDYATALVQEAIKREKRVRVNFDWTRSRWEEEYQRFVRRSSAVSLTNSEKGKEFPNIKNGLLRDEFVEFLEKGDTHACVISSPVRLIGEGHRQNHCIGDQSYIQEAACGNKMYMSVLIGKKRFTVTVSLKKCKGKTVAYVSQELSTNNRVPTYIERLKINARLLGEEAHKKSKKVNFAGTITINISEAIFEVPQDLMNLYGAKDTAAIRGIEAYVSRLLPQGKMPGEIQSIGIDKMTIAS